MRKKVIFGNWKMNGTNQEVRYFLKKIAKKAPNSNHVIAGLALPFTTLESGLKFGKKIKIAAQNVHYASNGAFTGEISIPMLEELGIKYVIIGHSERREHFHETDKTINQKIEALVKTDITPIVCCGESLKVKEAGKTIAHINQQITKDYAGIAADDVLKTIIAYEPIWAIGTGKTATPADAEEVCRAIRAKIRSLYNDHVADEIIILYGGSVTPSNIKALMKEPDIDGALVGGASLKVDDYLALINYEN